ncbi:MAG: hypothetical protein J6I41_05180 [Bacteroidales bacterium]|nr:hypothetical protein [Bacteroidales bacterium]
MKKFFAQDKTIVGIVAGLGSELGFCLAMAIGLLVAGEPIMAHVRWFGGMFIPLILVLHHYAKGGKQLHVTKTLIVVLFVTFLAFMIYLLKTKALVMQ